MLISHSHKITSISVPKTGSTSLHYALMSHLKIKFHMKNSAPALYHLSAEDIARIMGPGKFAAYFSFGVVRNPYDRMVSLFHDFCDQRQAIKAETFDDFLIHHFRQSWKDNVHFLPQSYFLCCGTEVMVDKAYRYEDSLETALHDIGERVGFRVEGIGHARKSERGSWQEYYRNPQVIEIVNAAYDEDFGIFGYDRIDPKQATEKEAGTGRG